MDRIIFRAECFEAYGLNRFRNFLRETSLELSEDRELYEFMCTIVNIHDCENCAVFAIDWYGGMWIGIKCIDNKDNIELLGREDLNINWFAEIDAEYRFCCYALMIEVRPGEWKVIDR